MRRFFCEKIDDGKPVILRGAQLRHLVKAVRLKTGDSVIVFDGKGKIAEAVIEKITKKEALLKSQSVQTLRRRSSQRIIIAASVAKGHRFETLTAKCTELGADVIVPVIFDRTVKQNSRDNSHKRLETIAVASTKQCGREFLPIIEKPLQLKDAAEKLTADFPEAQLLFGSPAQEAATMADFDFDDRDVIVFVGPEGGLDESEESFLTRYGAKAIRLTETVLPIETAAITAAAVLAVKRDGRL